MIPSSQYHPAALFETMGKCSTISQYRVWLREQIIEEGSDNNENKKHIRQTHPYDKPKMYLIYPPFYAPSVFTGRDWKADDCFWRYGLIRRKEPVR